MKRSMTLSAALLLAGCASFSRDGGFDAIEQVARERLGSDVRVVRSEDDDAKVRDQVRDRLSRPLGVDDAIQVALLNNRGLQGTYAELGIAEADLVQAGRLPNPRWSYLHVANGDALKIESVFTAQFVDLLTMPLRRRIEARRFEQAKLMVGDAVVRVASDTRKAYFAALAAEQSVSYFLQVREAAEAGAELARRMTRAGNWSALNQMREQAFYAEAATQLARARLESLAARERLTRVMGLWGSDTGFQLPQRLPDLPADQPQLAGIESYAIGERLDIRAARLETEGLASSLGLSRATRFVNVLELGPARVSETPDPSKRGYELIISIPIFDWGGARIAKAETLYMQSVNRLAHTAVSARSEVRAAYGAYLTAYEIARHYRDEVVPLRKKIADENVLRYNGMLLSVFELLADAREQVLAVNAYIGSLKDFWLAEAELQHAAGGTLPGATKIPGGPSTSGAVAPAASPPIAKPEGR